MAPDPSLTLLSRAHSPTRAQEIFSEKVILRPLYLKPTPASDSQTKASNDARGARQRARTLKQLSKRKSPGKPRPLSSKQKRALQVYAIPKSQQKWSIFEPIWNMWCGYIREILGLNSETQYNTKGASRWIDAKSAGPLLAGADFHGAMIKVVRSRCEGRVGLEGIVIRDTKFTFEIVTKGDELKILPKEYTVFRFEVPLVDEDSKEREVDSERGKGNNGNELEKPFVFELYGHFFLTRAPERASKKFVLHLHADL
ncbi:putative ribonuclease p complex subunit pop4 protein [Venturia nashicola]|nr:putative ribonuclease p complex subunit pop4 protein [Venturia nashicola]